MSKINDFVWKVESYLMGKYDWRTVENDLTPLKWYIYTGRAPMSFIRALVEKRPSVIARRLHKGGSDEEVIKDLKNYLGVVTYE